MLNTCDLWADPSWPASRKREIMSLSVQRLTTSISRPSTLLQSCGGVSLRKKSTDARPVMAKLTSRAPEPSVWPSRTIRSDACALPSDLTLRDAPASKGPCADFHPDSTSKLSHGIRSSGVPLPGASAPGAARPGASGEVPQPAIAAKTRRPARAGSDVPPRVARVCLDGLMLSFFPRLSAPLEQVFPTSRARR